MKTKLFVMSALLNAWGIFAQDEIPVNVKPDPIRYKNYVGFAAGNVSGVGLSYERTLFKNFSSVFVIGGVAQRSKSDFNTGLSFKYTFSRINKRVSVNIVTGGSYFLDIDRFNGIVDPTTGEITNERVRKYIKIGGGLGIEALFFDGRLGVDVNFIGIGASFQKPQAKNKWQFGDKPIRGPQVNLTYHF